MNSTIFVVLGREDYAPYPLWSDFQGVFNSLEQAQSSAEWGASCEYDRVQDGGAVRRMRWVEETQAFMNSRPQMVRLWSGYDPTNPDPDPKDDRLSMVAEIDPRRDYYRKED